MTAYSIDNISHTVCRIRCCYHANEGNERIIIEIIAVCSVCFSQFVCSRNIIDRRFSLAVRMGWFHGALNVYIMSASDYRVSEFSTAAGHLSFDTVN